MDITDFSPDSILHTKTHDALSKQQQKRLHTIAEYYRLGSSRTGICALFTGRNRAAKTSAVKALARQLSLPLLGVTVPALVSKYIGETEKNLNALFSRAEGSETILLFDEADALFGKRSEVNDTHDRNDNIDIYFLLARLENFIGIAVIATGYSPELNDTITRRCKYVLDFPLSVV